MQKVWTARAPPTASVGQNEDSNSLNVWLVGVCVERWPVFPTLCFPMILSCFLPLQRDSVVPGVVFPRRRVAVPDVVVAVR